MGKHSDSQSWTRTARDFASAVTTWNRKPQGRYSATRAEELTATGVLSTVRRRPIVAAIALPAAATVGIVASSLAMSPESGTVTAEAPAESTSESAEPAQTPEALTDEEIEEITEQEIEDLVSSLKDDERYQDSGASNLEAVPKPTPTPTQEAASAGAAVGSSDEGSDESGDSGDSGSGGVSDSPCSVSSGIESGLTSNAVAVYRAVCANFSEVSSYGGKRSDPGSDHNTGRAVDIMISGSTGDRILQFLLDNRSELGIDYLIWEQKIYGSFTGWSGRPMEDRGSVTANHYDHVHVSVT